ncbi:MAG: uroporphyrinogen decarboxylase [Caulobacteraceae bacterium]
MISRPSLLRVLEHETLSPPPIWFMRQAGRSLPEYRALRAKATDFIALCHDPRMAAEATLQPMRRFAFDAAIVFADILLLPRALGQKVWFEAGEGPRLGPLPDLSALEDEIEDSTARLSAVGETLGRVREALESDRALIGFAGGPWTVATYMIEGRGSDRSRAREMAFSEPAAVGRLVDLLAEATARYLAMQARAGAEALQIFESWAELLPEDVFERLVVRPHARIVSRLRSWNITAPVIGFARGAGALVERYAAGAGVQGIGLDVQAPAALGKRLQRRVAIQGALDPLLLRTGGALMEARVEALLDQWGPGPYIFNLGHGVLPDTPLEHIGQVVERVKGR